MFQHLFTFYIRPPFSPGDPSYRTRAQTSSCKNSAYTLAWLCLVSDARGTRRIAWIWSKSIRGCTAQGSWSRNASGVSCL